MTNLSRTLKLAPIAVFVLATAGWWVGCNQHPADYSKGSGAVEHEKTLSGGSKEKFDILWVIDNSGSMCEEQNALRKNFNQFIDTLDEVPIDFNLAVTTTNYSAPYEIVAPRDKLGHIQSTPHPPVGFEKKCQRDDSDEDGKYAKLRAQIDAAVACTENPENFANLKNLSDDQIKCALNDDATSACNRAGWNPDEVGPAHLFPCAHQKGKRCTKVSQLKDVYRDIPKVLRASNAKYRTSNGAVKIEKLKQDFACMSYVGTRGDSLEQGLQAAVKAVSPAKTGGTVGNPIKKGKNAPNHGFLREGAQTGVIFMTDENDCSRPDDVSILQKFQCGEMGCYYPTMPDRENQDPLFGTQKLAEQFLDNLAASKQTDVSEVQDQVVMASIHGTYQPYGTRSGQKLVEECGADRSKLRKAAEDCQTELGSATSGDRYEDFLRHFDRIFPRRSGAGGHLTGWMCQGNFGRAMEKMAETFRSGGGSCLEADPVTCTQNSDCPDYRWGAQNAAVCQPWEGNADQKVCRSAIQLRTSYANSGASKDKARQSLQDLGICYADSIGSENLPRGCVVRRDQ
ncbi:MAG: hypothetical protein ABEN55_19035, partial [Bradymonadaceae bacterium]